MQLLGLVNELSPAILPNGLPFPRRLRAQREAETMWSLDPAVAASEGRYFTAGNPTIGTALTWCDANRTAFSATAVSVVWQNNASDFGTPKLAPRIYPQFMRLLVISAGASQTDWQMAITMDSVPRWSSGGTLLLANATNGGRGPGVNPYANCSAIYAGNVTAKSATAQKNVGHMMLKKGTTNTIDEYLFTFGTMMPQGNFELNVNTAQLRKFDCGPFAIAPGGSLLFHFYGTAITTSPSYECEFGWIVD